MSNFQPYVSHKEVVAAKIDHVVHSIDGEVFVFAGGDRFIPNVPAMAEKAEVGDYAVKYKDGYQSISPAKAFEEGYFAMPEPMKHHLPQGPTNPIHFPTGAR